MKRIFCITAYAIALSVAGLMLIGANEARAATTVMFLTSNAAGDCGSQCFTVPSDWTDVNTIEAIGAGGSGRVGSNSGAGGGAGGAYSVISNLSGLTPGNTITFQVGANAGDGATGGDTFFNRTSGTATVCTAGVMSLCAKGGAGATSATGAATTSKANNIPANAGANGGKGGTGNTNADVGGGGGGAGGPHGDGQTGGAGSTGTTNAAGGGGGGADGGYAGASGGSSTTGGNGGDNRSKTGHGTGGTTSVNATAGTNGGGGAGGGGATSRHAGGAGSNEAVWTQTSDSSTAGPGSGGGGAGGVTSSTESTEHGGNGGGFGGGGGGSEITPSGHGTGGVIIVTYTRAVAPTVTTQSATSVTDTTAILNGNITNTGGQNAVTRGFAWGTTSSLNGGDTATSTESGSFGTGAFTDSSEVFTCNTTYYSRAYAINSHGDTGYGSISASFTTSACILPPTVTTNFAAPGFNSAMLSGTKTGGDNATEHGFAYGTDATLNGGTVSTTTLGALSSNDTFTQLISSLTADTPYYFRAYAIGATGTGYGSIRGFATGDSNVTRRIRLFEGSIIKLLNHKILFR